MWGKLSLAASFGTVGGISQNLEPARMGLASEEPDSVPKIIDHKARKGALGELAFVFLCVLRG